MKTILIILSISLGIYLFDKLCLWLESKDLLYYRHKKPQGGFVGNALLEFHSLLNPAVRNVVEMKQSNVKFKKSEEDAAGFLKK